jgi:hypothetical protein
LLELNEKLAVVAFVGLAGFAAIVTAGAVMSIVHVEDALPVLPAGSVAVTLNVWLPAARPLYVTPLEQGAAVPVSSWQTKVEPSLLEVKEKVAPVTLVGFDGLPVKVIVGAAVSTVHV